MVNQQYDLDTSTPFGQPSDARLFFTPFSQNGDFAVLRPTISRVLNTAPPADHVYRFTIEGTFGDDPGSQGKVTLGGTQLAIDKWTPDSIIVKVPPVFVPSGKFEVSIGPRKSEQAPFIDWVIPFTYTLTGQGTLQYVMTANCHLRADARGMRNLPQDVPAFTPLPTWALADSNGSVSASGELRDTQNNLVEQWSGGGALAWNDPAVNPTKNFVGCSGVFDHASSTIQSFVLLGEGDFTGTPHPESAGFKGITLPMTLTVNGQTLQINGNTLNAASNQLGTYGMSATLQWPSVLPANAPTDDDGR
jgi:hypothetical protein